ncbi:glutathione S-transferase A4-like [Perognathus longimembris pacificus]|uniref:glutathione S-transferase A4-like n=1 Tax=Perognathus longimembris pacificus TaxID=214514 RepID=UPI002019ABB6|nr:glutathione S-transferase A4-like [Perognathus longimembris pacificus]
MKNFWKLKNSFGSCRKRGAPALAAGARGGDGPGARADPSTLHYIADRHHLFGRNLEERTMIDMYVEGTLDLLESLIVRPFLKPAGQQKDLVAKAHEGHRGYFRVFESVLREGQHFLAGDQLSLAGAILPPNHSGPGRENSWRPEFISLPPGLYSEMN